MGQETNGIGAEKARKPIKGSVLIARGKAMSKPNWKQSDTEGT